MKIIISTYYCHEVGYVTRLAEENSMRIIRQPLDYLRLTEDELEENFQEILAADDAIVCCQLINLWTYYKSHGFARITELFNSAEEIILIYRTDINTQIKLHHCNADGTPKSISDLYFYSYDVMGRIYELFPDNTVALCYNDVIETPEMRVAEENYIANNLHVETIDVTVDYTALFPSR